MDSKVLISIVTHNDSRMLENCLDSLTGLASPARVKIWDNASVDDPASVASRYDVEFVSSPENLGYCGGHNRNIRGEAFDYVFFMNPDVCLSPDFFLRLLPALDPDPRIGMATGKILRMDPEGKPVRRNGVPVLDSTGIIFRRSQRHFDRGSEEEDRGQYDRRELIFGSTGAALLCRRSLVEDLSLNGEFWDEDFFAYREDADLAWRARLRGWEIIYEPSAVAMHLRHVFPGNRSRVSPLINMHSVKNRFLMRAKNMDWNLWFHCFPPILFRDFGIVAYILFRERSSLEAFKILWKKRRKIWRKRNLIQRGRLVYGREVSKWFL